MRRKGLIALFAALFAWGVAAIVLDSVSLDLSGSSATAPGGASPPCLPVTLEHTAALPGAAVDVSPAPETDTANPNTQISFLGVPASEIREVSVVGGHSGRHSGHL